MKLSKQRFEIIDKMEKVIEKPREQLAENAPKIINLKIDPNTIATLIGPSGKTIKSIIEQTNVAIDIEDDGKFVYLVLILRK